MAQQTINIGSSSNDGTGDPLRTAFNKINENFTELYGTSAFGQQVTISGNSITANSSNADLVLAGSGTGGVVASSLRIDGTSLSSSDSTVVSVNEGLNVDGSITASGDITASGNIFALRVRGESMCNAGILDGDIVMARQQSDAEKNDIVVALIGDEATVKRYAPENEIIRLLPENDSFEPIIISKETEDFSIAGKVVGLTRQL